MHGLGDRDACMILCCDERRQAAKRTCESCPGPATWAEWTEVMNIRSYATASDNDQVTRLIDDSLYILS